MQEEFVFLTSAPEEESVLVCQRLKDAGIRYSIKDHLDVGLGKRIFVLAGDLDRAKDFLGLKKSELLLLGRVKWSRSLIGKILAFIVLAITILFAIFGMIRTF